MGIDQTRRQQQQEKEALQLVVRGVWRQEWRAPNRILVVQRGTNEDWAKVFFRAHAVPQGLCENLNNALKLLANQHNLDHTGANLGTAFGGRRLAPLLPNNL